MKSVALILLLLSGDAFADEYWIGNSGLAWPNGAKFQVTHVLHVGDSGTMDVFTGRLDTVHPDGSQTFALAEFNCQTHIMYGLNTDGTHDGKLELPFDKAPMVNDIGKLCGQKLLTGKAASEACEASGRVAARECHQFLLAESAVPSSFTQQDFENAKKLQDAGLSGSTESQKRYSTYIKCTNNQAVTTQMKAYCNAQAGTNIQ